MGFDPMSLKVIRLAHEQGLGVGDPREIELVGDDFRREHAQESTLASRGQHLIYHGHLKPLEKILLRTANAPWSYAASVVYHDLYWVPAHRPQARGRGDEGQVGAAVRKLCGRRRGQPGRDGLRIGGLGPPTPSTLPH